MRLQAGMLGLLDGCRFPTRHVIMLPDRIASPESERRRIIPSTELSYVSMYDHLESLPWTGLGNQLVLVPRGAATLRLVLGGQEGSEGFIPFEPMGPAGSRPVGNLADLNASEDPVSALMVMIVFESGFQARTAEMSPGARLGSSQLEVRSQDASIADGFHCSGAAWLRSRTGLWRGWERK